MNKKLPDDAFQTYVAMGDSRTHQAIAEKYGVSRRCVTKRASAERWSERLSKMEGDARAITEQRMTEGLADMQERHTKLLRAMGARVALALQNYPLEGGMDAIRGGEIVIKMERLLAGESTARNTRTIEEITRHEIQTLLKVVPIEAEPRLVEVEVGASESDAEE